MEERDILKEVAGGYDSVVLQRHLANCDAH